MNDQWTDDIRKRMERRRTTAPKGLLDDVKREMGARGLEPLAPFARPKARLFNRNVYRAAAVAALLIALTATLTLLNENRLGQSITSLDPGSGRRPSETTRPMPAQPSITAIPTADDRQILQGTTDKSMVAMAYLSPLKGRISSTDPQTAAPTANEETATDTPATDNRPATPTPGTSQDTYEGAIALPTDRPRIKPRSSKFSMTTNYNSMGGTTTSNDVLLLATANPIGDYSDDLSGVNSRGVQQQTADEGKRTRHGLPVKVGVGLSYHLNGRWSLKTGLNYSRLSSETTHGPLLKDYRENQSLHYIGLPVAVTYTLVGGKHFNIYVSAGAEVEKLVSGKVTIHHKESDARASDQSRSLSEHRPQFSVNGGVGAEYLFGNGLSVYVEPGLRHYFNNGSSINNLYKDKPTNVSLGVGLRFHINR